MSIKTYKREGYLIKSKDFYTKKKLNYILDLIQKNGGEAYIRYGNFSNEIIWEGKSYSFPAKGKRKHFSRGIFLFGMVRRDARLFCARKKTIRVPKKYPANIYSYKEKVLKGNFTGTDVSHAYWRIAYNLGVISKRTYEAGMQDDFKSVRLAALSTLGKGKDYKIIRSGKETEESIKIGGNDKMDNIYKLIRYTCYRYMNEMKRLLKSDFIGYRTDCIYYIDSPENRKIIREYLKSKDLQFVQLIKTRKAIHEHDFSESS